MALIARVGGPQGRVDAPAHVGQDHLAERIGVHLQVLVEVQQVAGRGGGRADRPDEDLPRHDAVGPLGSDRLQQHVDGRNGSQQLLLGQTHGD